MPSMMMKMPCSTSGALPPQVAVLTHDLVHTCCCNLFHSHRITPSSTHPRVGTNASACSLHHGRPSPESALPSMPVQPLRYPERQGFAGPLFHTSLLPLLCELPSGLRDPSPSPPNFALPGHCRAASKIPHLTPFFLIPTLTVPSCLVVKDSAHANSMIPSYPLPA